MTFDVTLLRQPNHSTCGQTVVAMILGKPVEEVIKSLGSRKTWPQDLRTELARCGWLMAKRSSCRLPDVPNDPAVIFLRGVVKHRLTCHYTLWTGEKFFDPHYGVKTSYDNNWSGTCYPISKVTK